MHILDNLNALWGDDLKTMLRAGSRLKIAASCFSIYAYEALKNEFEQRLKQDADKLEKQMCREKQFNRRVELNRSLNALKAEIEGLQH